MRIVLDTNVLVSGLLSPHGPPGRIVDLVLTGSLTLVVDDRVLAEYRQVLTRRRFPFDPRDVAALLTRIEAGADHVRSEPCGRALPDSDDLPFLEVALSGAVDALVTGNARHYRGVGEVDVVSPADWLRRLG